VNELRTATFFWGCHGAAADYRAHMIGVLARRAVEAIEASCRSCAAKE